MTEFEISFFLHNADTGEIRHYELQLPIFGGRAEARETAKAVAAAAVGGAGPLWAVSDTSVREV